MIKNKRDLRYYLSQDKTALFKAYSRPKPFQDEVWRFQILLRKCEYAENCLKGPIYKPYKLFLKLRFHKLSLKLGFSIPLNVFEEGLSIAHYGTIVVNGNARIGKNCRIQEDVNIGSTDGSTMAPEIGNDVFIGTGAKIIGDIVLADGIAIGAGAVVTKSFSEEGITIAGVPAKKISDNGLKNFICSKLREGAVNEKG